MSRLTHLHSHGRIIRRLVLEMGPVPPVVLVIPALQPRKLSITATQMLHTWLLNRLHQIPVLGGTLADPSDGDPPPVLVTRPVGQVIALGHFEQSVKVDGVVSQLKVSRHHCSTSVYVKIILGHVVTGLCALKVPLVLAADVRHRPFCEQEVNF